MISFARRAKVAVVIILGIGIPVALTVARRTPPSDHDQILSLLQAGEKAVEAQDLQATMALISGDYEDGFGNSRDDLRAYAIAYYREADRISIALDRPSVRLTGSRARVDVTVTIDTRTRGSLSSQRMTVPVTLHLAKEPARRFLILPCKRWRVTSVSVSPPTDEMWLF